MVANFLSRSRFAPAAVLAIFPAVALAAVIFPSAWAGGPLPLAVEVHARSVAPGEPIRIVVRSTIALSELDGTFLGRELFLSRASDGQDQDRWEGWSMVELDREPGMAAIELRGTTRDGRPAAGTHALRIESREFPVEELSVASKYVQPSPETEERLARERRKLTEIYTRRRPVEAGNGPFVRPVPGEPTSIFGTRRIYNGQPRSPHPGLDLRAATGVPIVAAGDGLVVLAEDLYYSGNTVILDHGGGLFTLYAHLSAIDVSEGDPARAGERIGLAGATGRVTGPHLHWGAKIGDSPFDPRALLDPALFD